MEFQVILMQKIDRLESDLRYFISTSGHDLAKINQHVDEIRKQTTLTNSRVNKLEDRIKVIEEIEAKCPAANIERSLDDFRNEMSVYVFLSKHWKIAAAFLGIIFAIYSTVMTLATKVL